MWSGIGCIVPDALLLCRGRRCFASVSVSSLDVAAFNNYALLVAIDPDVSSVAAAAHHAKQYVACAAACAITAATVGRAVSASSSKQQLDSQEICMLAVNGYLV